MQLLFSGACSIELTTGSLYNAPSIVMSGVILTGGKPTYRNKWRSNRVVQYDMNGFVADLPDLVTGRMDHACSFYYGRASVEGVSRNRRVSIYIMRVLFHKLLKLHTKKHP